MNEALHLLIVDDRAVVRMGLAPLLCGLRGVCNVSDLPGAHAAPEPGAWAMCLAGLGVVRVPEGRRG